MNKKGEKTRKFFQATGLMPEQDDLERSFCELAGQLGHSQCGWCDVSNKPRFMCGCADCFNRARGLKSCI